MTIYDKNGIHRKTVFNHLLRRFCAGASAVKDCRPSNLLMVALYALMSALVWEFGGSLLGLDGGGPLASAVGTMADAVLLVCILLGWVILFVLMGTPRGSGSTYEAFQRIGFVNSAGEAPILVSKRRDKGNPMLTVWEFDPCGIPLGDWKDKQARIEAVLNIIVAQVSWADNRKLIQVCAVPAMSDLPSLLHWKDEYLSPDNFVLVLGESLLGLVTVNLAHIPHILLGGSTGSGKSALLKLLLMQALHKGAELFIADFKGGIDFLPIWHFKCWMCFNEHDLLKMLTDLVNELKRRKALFQDAGCSDIDAYNRLEQEHLKRWVFACDEVAEVLDKTGRSKEDKEVLTKIENKLSTIARLGRAFGIHLILATQRPDANILPGQVKNNLDFRVCGRADNVLSQIILDNTSAADQIPKDARGRFITGDGTVFQGYLFDEGQL